MGFQAAQAAQRADPRRGASVSIGFLFFFLPSRADFPWTAEPSSGSRSLEEGRGGDDSFRSLAPGVPFVKIVRVDFDSRELCFRVPFCSPSSPLRRSLAAASPTAC